MDDASLAQELTSLMTTCGDLAHAKAATQHVLRHAEWASVKAVADAIDATRPAAVPPEHRPMLPDRTGGVRDITDAAMWSTEYLRREAARMRAELPVIMRPWIESFETEIARREAVAGEEAA